MYPITLKVYAKFIKEDEEIRHRKIDKVGKIFNL